MSDNIGKIGWIDMTVDNADGLRDFYQMVVGWNVEETSMGEYQPGRTFNLEVDIIARYLERLLLGDKAAQTGSGGITKELLQRCGFAGAAD